MQRIRQSIGRVRTAIVLFLAIAVTVVLGRDSIVATLYGQAQAAEIEPQYTFNQNAPANKLTTQFLYQGNLAVSGEAASGEFNFRVRLYNAASGGAQIGPENIFTDTVLTGGTFSLYLDYNDVFNGEMRWLEIDVQGEGEEEFTTLSPRQAVNPVPYALYAESTQELWQMAEVGTDVSSGAITGGNRGYQSFNSDINPFPNPVINLVEVALVPKQVERLFILGRGNGQFEGAYTLQFQVRGFDGTLKRTVSAEPFDLNELSVDTEETRVIEIAVSGNPEDRIVNQNEYLAVYVFREGEAGGDLSIALNAYAMVRNAVLPEAGSAQ